MQLHPCASREDYLALVNGPEFTVRWMLENHIAARYRGASGFVLPGVCVVCNTAVDFEVSFEGAWHGPDGAVIPNWREFLRCPRCGFNGRQRMITRLITDAILADDRPRVATVYVMEQTTPLYRWLCETFSWLTVIGSEYLGPGTVGGRTVGGVRHEDAERLSFADASIDVLVSCDVFEHVNEPVAAFREVRRVLRPGGRALLTFPVELTQDRNVRRARMVDGRVEALLPEVYHANPLSPDGSLVFTDFGWEALEQLRAAGLADATLTVYWSYALGYLGPQFYFSARRDTAAGVSPT